MASAESTARYVLWLASQEDEPSLLTPLQLQKLLYYCQGVAVAAGQPLFSERIKAWVHGPVVPQVYHAFKHYGQSPIPFSEGSSVALSDKHQRELVHSVWQVYGRYSAGELRRMTHEEQPWRDARRGVHDDEPSQAEITNEALQAHFGPMLDGSKLPEGVRPADLLEAERDFKAGRGIRLADLEHRWRDAV